MNNPRVIKFGEWWDGESFTTDNPYHKESFAYWAWEGWQAGWNAKKPWVGLTPEEREECIAWAHDLDSTAYSKYLAKMIEYKLKEKNGG